MAILSLKEFGDSMGMSYNTVKVNSQRGKIIKGTNGKIDTENAVNKLFFDKQIILKGTKPELKKDVNTVEKIVIEKPNTQTKEQKIYRDLDLRTKIAIVELKEREAEVKRIQLEKSAGNLLPVDIVEKVLVINFQSIFKNLDSEIENKCYLWGERLNATQDQIIEMISHERVFLSKCIEKAKIDANHQFATSIKEHQEIKYNK